MDTFIEKYQGPKWFKNILKFLIFLLKNKIFSEKYKKNRYFYRKVLQNSHGGNISLTKLFKNFFNYGKICIIFTILTSSEAPRTFTLLCKPFLEHFLSYKNETSHQLNNDSSFFPFLRLWQPPFY